jgi:hypothetical protein
MRAAVSIFTSQVCSTALFLQAKDAPALTFSNGGLSYSIEYSADSLFAGLHFWYYPSYATGVASRLLTLYPTDHLWKASVN